jgi:hypothetical protein
MKDKAPNIEADIEAQNALFEAHSRLSEIKNADFHEWARKAYWSAEECVALIFRKDPHQCNRQKIEDIFPADLADSFAQDLADSFAQNYIAAHEQILAAQRNKELPERIRPIEFLAWARQYKNDFSYFLVPYLLEKAVSANELDIAQLQDRYEKLRRENQRLRYEMDRLRAAADAAPTPEPKEVTTRQRSSLLKMVIAMAMAKYGYDRIKRNTAAGDIADEIQAREMELSEDTVRGFLQDAADEVLPKQADEESA